MAYQRFDNEDRDKWPEVTTDEVYLIRILRGYRRRGRKLLTWTIVLKNKGHVHGKQGDSKRDVIAKLEQRFKVRVKGYTRYKGHCGLAEAAMTIMDLVPEKDNEE